MEAHGLAWYESERTTMAEAEEVGRNILNHSLEWGYITPYYNNLWADAKYKKFPGASFVECTQDDSDLMSWNGKKVIKDNKVYILTVGTGTELSGAEYTQYYTGEDTICNDWLSQLYYEYKTHYFLYRNQDNPSRNKVRIDFKGQLYNIIATETLDDTTITYTLPASSSRTTCKDALYDMFAMPINPTALGIAHAAGIPDETVRFNKTGTGGFNVYLSSATDIHLAIATMLSSKLGAGQSGALNYDLQLLPYCPIPSLVNHVSEQGRNGDGRIYSVVISLSGLTQDLDYTVLYNNETTPQACGIVFYPSKANFTTSIDLRGLDKRLLWNKHIINEVQEIKDPVFEFSGSDEDGYYWFWSEGFQYGILNGDFSFDDFTVNINGYNPSDYAYGG